MIVLILGILKYTIIGVLVVLIIDYLLTKYFQQKIKNKKKTRVLHGPTMIMGLKDFIFKNSSTQDVLLKFPKLYGQTFVLHLFNFPIVFTSKPEEIYKILKNTKDFPKDDETMDKMPEFSQKLLGGKNVVLSEGQIWKKHRKIVDTGFFNLDPYFKKMKETVDCIISIFEKEGKIHNIDELCQHFTLDVLGKCIFGHDFSSLTGNDSGFKNELKAYNDAIRGLSNLPALFMMALFSRFKFIPFVKKIHDAVDTINSMIDRLVKNSKNKLKENSGKTEHLLDFMVKSSMEGDESERLNYDELKSNILIFFIAGHETTASTLSIGLHLLALNKNIQSRIREEVINVLETAKKNDSSEKKKNLEDYLNEVTIKKFNYMNAFIKENMRLYPPAPLIKSRKCSEDTLVDGYLIPKGTNLNLITCAAQRDETIFEEPDQCKPERWLTEDKTKLSLMNKYWFPFGMGPRICLGNNFSLMEQRIFLGTLLLKFDVSFEDKSIKCLELSKNGSFLKPELRTLVFEKLK